MSISYIIIDSLILKFSQRNLFHVSRTLHHRFEQPPSGRRKFVKNARVLQSVVLRVAVLQRIELVLRHQISSDQRIQELVVNNMLILSNVDFPGLLEDAVVRPEGIQFRKRRCQAIVISRPDGDDGRQQRALVADAAARFEADRVVSRVAAVGFFSRN